MGILDRTINNAINKGQASIKDSTDKMILQQEEIINNLNDVMVLLHKIAKHNGIDSGLEDENGKPVEEIDDEETIIVDSEEKN